MNDVLNNAHNNKHIKISNLNNIYYKKQSENQLIQFHINIIKKFNKIG